MLLGEGRDERGFGIDIAGGVISFRSQRFLEKRFHA
jgi:hypothetical protein